MAADLKPTPLPERAVQKAIMQGAYQVLGLRFRRTNVGGFYNRSNVYVSFSERGTPDLWTILKDGRHCAVEVKKEGFRPEKLKGEKLNHFQRQVGQMQRICLEGGAAFWADDAGRCLEILRRLQEGAWIDFEGWNFYINWS